MLGYAAIMSQYQVVHGLSIWKAFAFAGKPSSKCTRKDPLNLSLASYDSPSFGNVAVKQGYSVIKIAYSSQHWHHFLKLRDGLMIYMPITFT